MKNTEWSSRRSAPTFIAAAGLLACVSWAQARPEIGLNIDIDFGFVGDSSTGTPVSSYGAASGQTGQWTTVTFGAGPYILSGLGGSPTAVTLTRTGATNLTTFVSGGPTDYQKLVGDADSITGTTTYTFTGLPAGRYTIYTYAAAPSITTASTRIDAPDGTGGAQTVGGAPTSYAYVQGQTHAVHVVTTTGGPVNIVATKIGQSAVVNGFQIVPNPVPPPPPPPPPPPADLTAAITSPPPCTQLVDGPIEIRGTAGGTGFLSWTLQYTGGSATTWTTIASGTSPVVNGPLGTWNTGTLTRPCGYTVRLIVNTTAGQMIEGVRSYYAGMIGDANLNANVAFDDISSVLSNMQLGP